MIPRESTHETELTYPIAIQDYLCTDGSRADHSLSRLASLFPPDLKLYEQEDAAADDEQASPGSTEIRRPYTDRPQSAVPCSLHPEYVPRKHLEKRIRDMLSKRGARVALVGLPKTGLVSSLVKKMCLRLIDLQQNAACSSTCAGGHQSAHSSTCDVDTCQ